MVGIERPMTSQELKGLTVNGVPGVDLNKPKRKMNVRELFNKELFKQEADANFNKLPFARHAAREEFESQIKSQIDKQLREYGSIEHPEKLKVPVIDWKKYSDLDNFELIETHERADTNLSKQNPGLNVLCKVETYKFKGYGQTYKVMEDGPTAITRAIKNRAKLDQSISEELKTEKKSEIRKNK